MLHIESNTQHNIFYSAIKDKFLRITCSTLCLNDFIAKAKKLLESNKQKYSKFNATSSSLQKTISAHTESFQRFSLFSCFFFGTDIRNKWPKSCSRPSTDDLQFYLLLKWLQSLLFSFFPFLFVFVLIN